MKQLIITADDYGMCEPVNAAIEECLAAGAMRATCVMTNMPRYAETAALRQRFPEASIGLHWTLTQGRSVLPAARVPTLVGSDGELLPFALLRQRLMARRVDVGQIRDELAAQYVRFVEVGGSPDFWNTHENIHVTPGLYQLCAALGRELGIPAMRSNRRVTVWSRGPALAFNLRYPLYWAKGQVISRWTTAARRRGTVMPAGSINAHGFAEGNAAVEAIAARARWAAPLPAELIVHPATHVDAALFGKLTDSRLREYRVLRDAELRTRLLHYGIETVGFEVLHHDRTAAQASAQPTGSL